jgi:hypothetical protein
VTVGTVIQPPWPTKRDDAREAHGFTGHYSSEFICRPVTMLLVCPGGNTVAYFHIQSDVKVLILPISLHLFDKHWKITVMFFF